MFTIEKIKSSILPVLESHGIKKAGLFGSFARGEETESSDIDILVKIDKDISLLDFVGIKLDIERALGKEVDLVEYETVKPLLKKRIMAEEIPIL